MTRLVAHLLVLIAAAACTAVTAYPTAMAAEPGLRSVPKTTSVRLPAKLSTGPQIWAACGLFGKTGKVVRTYGELAGVKRVHLTCGGPKYDSQPTWGYRHIVRYHEQHFEGMAAGTFQNWREVADIGIATALADPEVRGFVRDGKRCFSRTIRLYNTRTGQVVRTQIVRVVFRTSDNAIITAYPSRQHC